MGAHRGRLRQLLHRRGVRVGLLPEQQQLRARHRRVHARRAGRPRLAPARGHRFEPHPQDRQGSRADAAHRRVGVAVRRSRHAVRHDHQRLAHVRRDRTHQREQPLQRVHVPRRHELQPREPQPHAVPQRRRLDRHRVLQARDPHHDHRAGDPGQQRLVPDREDRQEQRGVPPARSRLREPRRAPHGARRAVRLAPGSRPRRLPHLDPHRRGVRAVSAHRARGRRVQRLRGQPPADAPRGRQASRGRVQHPHRQHRGRPHRRRSSRVGRGPRARCPPRVSQLAGDGARTDRDDQLHARLRHHRRRAGHRARQVQEARRRRDAEDGQRHRAAPRCAASAMARPRSATSSPTSTRTTPSRVRRRCATRTSPSSIARSPRRTASARSRGRATSG